MPIGMPLRRPMRMLRRFIGPSGDPEQVAGLLDLDVPGGDLEADGVGVVAGTRVGLHSRVSRHHSRVSEVSGDAGIEAAGVQPLLDLIGLEAGFGPGLSGIVGISTVGKVPMPLDYLADRHRGKPPSESNCRPVV